jgi:hypothetical protein
VDDRDDGQQAQDYLELEHDTLEALERCLKAGGRPDDLYFLAAQLGVGERFRKHYGPDARR